MWVGIKNKILLSVFIVALITLILTFSFVFATSCPTSITSCGCNLDNWGTMYTLANNISVNGTVCLNITSVDTYLDCEGHYIIGNKSTSFQHIGVDISNSDDVVRNCNIKDFMFGINLDADGQYGSVIYWNNIFNNSRGIRLVNSNTNGIYIHHNRIFNNTYGVVISGAYDNYIYNNSFFDNTNNAYDDTPGWNNWNTTKTSGTNIIGGPYIGGNYWDDYIGDDTDGDGLGETPYNIPDNTAKDYLPLVDINSPQYSNINEPTDPSVYSPSASYGFNITWTDNIAVDTVILEFNQTDPVSSTLQNYTDVTKTGDVYNKTFYDLPVGTYEYRWYANDTRDNWNSTDSLNFTIEKASSSVSITISPSSSVTYPTETNDSCSIDTGDPSAILTLYRNGTQVTNPDVNTLAANVYNYTCVYEESQNYTSSSSENFLTVNKGPTSIDIWLNSGTVNQDNTITYPTEANATCAINISSQNDFYLYRNGTSVGSQVGQKIEYVELLPAKVWNFTCYYPETENYTSYTRTNYLSVNKTSRTMALTFYPPSPITYEDQVNASCSVSAGANDGTLGLFRNQTDVTSENDIFVLLPAGVWDYECNITEGENYTSATTSNTLTINKKNANVQLSPTTQTITYGTSVLQYCTDESDLLDCLLYRNGTLIPNNTYEVLDVGVYNYVANISDDYNYTNYQNTSTLTVVEGVVHDVAITNVTPSLNETYPHEKHSVNITITAKNEGTETESFDVNAYYYNETIPTEALIGTYPVSNLVQGEETTFNITWNTTDVEPCYIYEIKANVTTVSGETDTSDNTLIDGNVYVKILFDIDGNAEVDIVDVVIAAIAYGSKPGNPNWNPEADLNKDGIVDIVDIVMVAIHFGETC